MLKVLITGGAGFIGSTIASACADGGITPVILDDLSTGRAEFVKDRIFYRGDIADARLVARIFAEHPGIGAVVHCAGRIVVPESVEKPLLYYQENVVKTLALVEALIDVGCGRLVFSSSASIYAPGPDLTVDEDSPLAPSSPYARTKMVVELMLRDVADSGGLQVVALRYFNPIGADPQRRSGLQLMQPTHALGRLIEVDHTGEPFVITGHDWPTRDGTGIRDYVHVWDLAMAHVATLRRFEAALDGNPYNVINIGTGSGTTVRELVEAYSLVQRRPVPTRLVDRRPGDVAGCFTRSDRARRLLHWRSTRTVADGIRDAVAWAEYRHMVLGY